MWATSVIFKELPKVNIHIPNWRKFEQSGHPACMYVPF
jgi:hypothetical protein